MKIILTQPEIEAVLKKHVLNTVQLKDNQDIQIDFTSTRGSDGITASVEIPYIGLASLNLASPSIPQRDTFNSSVDTSEEDRDAANTPSATDTLFSLSK
jgi:hypothetical protein